MSKIIEFGRYLTKENELREIEWQILDELPDGKKLLITKQCIESMQYEYSENKNKKPNWENGVVRFWLNGYFLNKWFTVREKEQMSPIRVETPEGIILEDKVILLSVEEVEKYMPNLNDRRAKPTAKAKRAQDGMKLYTEKGYCTWLLRNPSEIFEGNWTGVGPDGTIDLVGGDFFRSGPQGIRPVIVLKDIY